MAKKFLTSKQLLFLAIGAFGIQFATALQMSNMSSLYKFLGAGSGDLSYLWLAAPIAGLIIQPLVGQLSDSTVSRYGKRIPYIWCWGILGALAIFIMPLASAVWVAASLLWIIECSINGCTESLRALTVDLTTTVQRAKAFAVQTIFAGTGSGMAATLPWLIHHYFHHFSSKISGNNIPITIKSAFMIGSVVLVICVLLISFFIKEKIEDKRQTLSQNSKSSFSYKLHSLFQFFSNLLNNVKNMPEVIRKFYLIQFFTWIGLFCMWLYLNLAISQRIFGLPCGINVSTNYHYAHLLEKGTEWGGVCYGIYQFTSVLYATIIPYLTKRTSPKLIHALSLMIGAIGLISLSLVSDKIYTIFSMVGVGVMWGSIMTLPYTIISAELPVKKIGVYLGIFNITITIPQIASGLTLSFISSKIFHNHAAYTVALGGACIFIAGILLIRQFLLEAVKLDRDLMETDF